MTGLLADYGADVIWVEPPGGDPFRGEQAVWYSVINRGKCSVELDLPTERDQLLELIGTADIFVQSWRPGVAERLGLGYAELHARRSDLVYCSISGFGPDERYRDLAGYESIVHALAGSMADQGGFREGPIFEGLPFASFGASYLALIGTLAAVYRRHTDGIGRHVETSLLDGALAYLSLLVSDVDTGISSFVPGTTRTLNRPLLCADEEPSYLCLHTGAVGGWGRFLKLAGLDDRVGALDSGLDLGMPLSREEAEIIDTEVPKIFLQRTRAEWMEALVAADLAATEVLNPCECFDRPQVLHNEMVVRVHDEQLGDLDQVAPPVKFGATPAQVRRGAPRVGEHNGELADLAASPERPPPAAPEQTAPAVQQPLLAGLRILDLGSHHAGPYAARLLADLGADVIKVEPVRGDIQRGVPTTFRNAQANKRAAAIDLKAEQTQGIKNDLLAWADVVLHNMRPGAAERMGVGYADVQAVNPQVVYLHAPGWGGSGPWMNRQSFEPLQSFYLGAGFEVAGEFNPPVMPAGLADSGAGLVSAVGIMMALVSRQRTGAGQKLESPQLNATMNHVAHIVRDPSGQVLGGGRLDPLQLGYGALERLYETQDGWLCVVAKSAREVAALAEATGAGFSADPRFATAQARAEHDYELAELLATALRGATSEQWRDRLAAARVPAAIPLFGDRKSFFRDPVHQRIGRVAECADPTYGHVREAALLVRVSDARPVSHRLAPALGEHTGEVLSWLGVESATIDELRTNGLVF
jgi:crotonobetainyl-CoA:carnitine CoA-transferase CaiB-like acyl-CoA transferase